MTPDLPPAIEQVALEHGGYVFRDESILGTRLQIVLVADNFFAAQAAAIAARAEIDRLNLVLNARDPSSELSLLNRARDHVASAELFEVVSLAERWFAATNGAFSGRLGRVLDAWRDAVDRVPSRGLLSGLAQAANAASVVLDATTRTITRPATAVFALDALAKGWIVDRAFEIARNGAGVQGAMVDIGGDVRCGGLAPGPEGWCVGVADPMLPFDNAPLVATARLTEHAIATSGRGPRDRIMGKAIYSATVSPFDGWPIEHHLSATAIARTAADADALATALLVMPQRQALAFAASNDTPARITARDGSPAWTQPVHAEAPTHFTAVTAREARSSVATATEWQDGWQALATFTAPRRQLLRDPEFRSPYMAMWLTDLDNRPIRTLLLVGKRAEWQKDNFIWWSMHRERTDRLVSTRSMSTSGAGVYNVFWDGVDDSGQSVAPGTYVLHVETSRERGKHTYRALTLDFAKFERFENILAPTEEGGGLRVGFDHY